jgi:hypothetical protein
MQVKSNEIRIGNWISDRGLKEWQIDHWETINKVASKANATMCNGILMETHPLTEYVDFLKPIAINENWLKKLGFKKESSEWKLFPCAEVQIIVFNEKNYNGVMFYTRTIHTEYTPIYCGSQINYVHQLQNLYYALTGTELSVY